MGTCKIQIRRWKANHRKCTMDVGIIKYIFIWDSWFSFSLSPYCLQPADGKKAAHVPGVTTNVPRADVYPRSKQTGDHDISALRRNNAQSPPAVVRCCDSVYCILYPCEQRYRHGPPWPRRNPWSEDPPPDDITPRGTCCTDKTNCPNTGSPMPAYFTEAGKADLAFSKTFSATGIARLFKPLATALAFSSAASFNLLCLATRR